MPILLSSYPRSNKGGGGDDGVTVKELVELQATNQLLSLKSDHVLIKPLSLMCYAKRYNFEIDNFFIALPNNDDILKLVKLS